MRPWTSLPLALALALAGCAHGDYVWARDLPAPPPPPSRYLIGTGDLLAVRVWNQDGMSSRSRVRADGRISLPFLDDVEAAGLAPDQLAAELKARLKDLVVNPVVTVFVEESRPPTVSVLGEVVKAGVYPFEPGSGVLHGLAAAGGLSPWADRGGIYVLRAGPPATRIRFTWDLLTEANGHAPFRLQAGDVVVVE